MVVVIVVELIVIVVELIVIIVELIVIVVELIVLVVVVLKGFKKFKNGTPYVPHFPALHDLSSTSSPLQSRSGF